MKLLGLFNRDGGTFRTTDMEAFCKAAETAFQSAGHTIECNVVSGNDIVETMEKAAQRDDLDGLVAGGGDGTISAAAAIAWKSGLTLGIVPAGTMNLFARSLKIPLDIWKALDALASADEAEVDIGSANGRPFVHQFSAGLHARLVRYRNAMPYRSRIGKMGASTRAAVGVMFNPPEFDVDFLADGVTQRLRVSAISVSNNPFGRDPLLFADDLTTGHLGFYAANALRPVGVMRLAFDILRGKLKENADVTAMAVPAIDLHFPNVVRSANCVIDGELLPMGQDVALRLHPGELKVLKPQPQPAPQWLGALTGAPQTPSR